MSRGFLVLVLVLPACGPSQVCIDYVACQQAYDARVDVTAYQPGGACWDTTLSTANACSTQCAAALDALAQVPAPPEACLAIGP